MPKMEKRTFKLEASSAKEGKLRGHAAVYNEWSPMMQGFRERIADGAFNRAIAEKQDVRALWNHNSDLVLGRTTNGTLELKSDEKGLSVDITPPDTTWGKDARTSIERGDVDQMSFQFRCKKDEWEYDEETDIVSRTLVDVDLFDVSPTTFPAYEGTGIDARGEGEMPQSIIDKIAECRSAKNEAEAGAEVEWEETQECYDLRMKQLDLLSKQ